MSLITEVSYTHLFGQNTSLSGGMQNTLSHNRNKYLLTDYSPVLTENHNYIYASFGQQVRRVWFSVSGGLKLFWTNNDDNKRSFISPLAIARLNWNISQQWNLSGVFRYSPGIPSLSSLTDYSQQITPYLISNGNRDLKKSQTYTCQLSPSFYSPKVTATLALYYSETRNPVFSEVSYLGNHMFLSQELNARKFWWTSGELNLKIGDFAGFGANISLELSHYETLGQNWSLHLTSFEPRISLWYTKGPFTISYFRKFPGKYLGGSRVGKSENSDALSFSYRPDNHWRMGINWCYMFDKKGTHYLSWDYSPVNPGYSRRDIHNNGNMVTLYVSYTTDFGSIFRSGRRTLNNSDNSSSLRRT